MWLKTRGFCVCNRTGTHRNIKVQNQPAYVTFSALWESVPSPRLMSVVGRSVGEVLVCILPSRFRIGRVVCVSSGIECKQYSYYTQIEAEWKHVRKQSARLGVAPFRSTRRLQGNRRIMCKKSSLKWSFSLLLLFYPLYLHSCDAEWRLTVAAYRGVCAFVLFPHFYCPFFEQIQVLRGLHLRHTLGHACRPMVCIS